MSGRHKVQTQVTATVGPVELRHFPISGGGYDSDMMPEAVLGRCVVTFHFGTRRRSKTFRGAYRWTTPTGWPRATPASEAEVKGAGPSIVGMIAVQLREHGIIVDRLDVQQLNDDGAITGGWHHQINEAWPDYLDIGPRIDDSEATS